MYNYKKYLRQKHTHTSKYAEKISYILERIHERFFHFYGKKSSFRSDSLFHCLFLCCKKHKR